MKDIRLINFRCYEEKTMEFRRGINLLIGDNAVGKTSLLRACNLVSSAFFAGYSDEYTVWKGPEKDDFREINDSQISQNNWPIRIEFHMDEHDCPPILFDGKPDLLVNDFGQAFSIEKRSPKTNSNLRKGLKGYQWYSSLLEANSHFILDGVAHQTYTLPIFGYYSTEDIHSARVVKMELFKKYPQRPSFGYYESNNCRGLLDCWVKRLLVLKEARKGDSEIACVRNAVISVLGPDGCGIISDLDIRVNDGKVYFELFDGRSISSKYLSDGYRRLVSIVVDMAFRCALLNKVKHGQEAYKETHGTVIIDEIDEHLHPELQVRVMKALHNTFPKIQFIVSTHAPLVMSSVETNEDNVVYKLEYKDGIYSHKELNTYGLDASTIMEVYMDQVPRDLTIDKEIKAIEKLIDEEEYGKARNSLNKMYDTPGSEANPELSKLEATLSFFEV